MKLLKRLVLLTICALIFSTSLVGTEKLKKHYEQNYQEKIIGINTLRYLKKSYPDIIFDSVYIKEYNDWLIIVTVPKTPGQQDENGIKYEFYWADGKLLPENELKNIDKYWSLFTFYPEEIRDPTTYSPAEKQAILEYGSDQNRFSGKGTPMFFFDAIYDTKTRVSTERHIKKIKFLNKTTNIHERLEAPLKRVEEKILAAAEESQEIKDFLKSITSYDSYSWREIHGTKRRSFHGLGVAIDIMPKYLAGKHIFWSWTKDRFPTTWMEIPLSQRWIPPRDVIEIFESEGFIWGGKWVIYDNMHFEYHPELILYNIHHFD